MEKCLLICLLFTIQIKRTNGSLIIFNVKSLGIFFFSIENFINSFVTYRIYRKYLNKISELCTAEFLNNKYLVPCDPVKRLNEMYGYNDWETKKQVNSVYNLENLGPWPGRVWPNVNKFYDISGKLNLNRTASHANNYINGF
jgi:hypothetical protein